MAIKPHLKVISVASGKGGVGKTHLAVNLATLASQRGLRTLIVDSNIGLSNADVLMGVSVERHLGHLLDGAPLDEVLLQTADGPWLLPAGCGDRAITRLRDCDMLALSALWHELAERFDVIVIDSAPGASPDVLFFSSLAQHVVMVVTNEPTSIADAAVFAHALRTQTAVRSVDVVVNGSRSDRAAAAVFGKLEAFVTPRMGLTLRFRGHVPEDHNLRRAAAVQRPLVLLAPHSPASRAFNRIAEAMFALAPRVSSGVAIGLERVLGETHSSRR